MCKVVAAAPRITVGSSLLTAGGTLAIKSARIAPNLPRCGAFGWAERAGSGLAYALSSAFCG
jgi:hypothetical protein